MTTRRRPAWRRRAAAALAIVTLAAPPGARADEAGAAPPGALACSGCHAPATLATAIPALDGRAAGDMLAALLDFRAGRRHATVMDRIAKGFTEDELAAIAAYIARAPR